MSYWTDDILAACDDQPDESQDDLADFDGLVAMFKETVDGDEREETP